MSTRRDFFKVLFAAGIATAVPAILGESLPTIYGDGIHDDTEGLQAAFDGKAFLCPDQYVSVQDGFVMLDGGDYIVSKTVHCNRAQGMLAVSMRNAHIHSTCEDYVFYLHGNGSGQTNVFAHCHFDYKPEASFLGGSNA